MVDIVRYYSRTPGWDGFTGGWDNVEDLATHPLSPPLEGLTRQGVDLSVI